MTVGKKVYISVLSSGRSILPGSVVTDCPDFSVLDITQLNINLKNGEAWDPDIPVFSGDPVLLKEKEKIIAGILNRENPAQDRFTEKVLAESPLDLKRLIGLGTGSTPSGDDFLVGALTCSAYINQDLFELVSNEIADLIDRTVITSVFFLRQALEKKTSEKILALFSETDAAETENKCRDIMNTGANSGYYTLKGILWVLKKTL